MSGSPFALFTNNTRTVHNRFQFNKNHLNATLRVEVQVCMCYKYERKPLFVTLTWLCVDNGKIGKTG